MFAYALILAGIVLFWALFTGRAERVFSALIGQQWAPSAPGWGGGGGAFGGGGGGGGSAGGD